mmetsp:Transcript_70925/g.125358  ORF Transcript_70925/g.125358 Transcript_70925/m.125358 type:complete len:208 (+) Transcript_70925:994-1617(+)
MIALNIKLDDTSCCQLCVTVLRKQGVAMQKEISRKLVAVHEAPSTLEGAYHPLQSTTNPITGPEQGACGDLLGDSATSLVQGYVELHCLTSAQRRLAFLELLWSQKQVISVHEQITVESGGIQEPPSIGKSTHIASMTLTQAVCRLPPHDGFQSDCMRTATIISLHIKLNTFALLELIALALKHDAFSLEAQLPLEQVALDKAGSAA